MKPPLNVLLGPARSGKTRSCIARLKSEASGAWLLVPSDPEAEFVRKRAKPTGAPTHRICSLANFARQIAGEEVDTTELVSAPLQRAALNEVLERSGGFFERMRDTPGFFAAIGEAIREIKLAATEPPRLEAAIELAAPNVNDPAFAVKARAIAELYRGYVEFLRTHDLRDEQDLFQIAAMRADRETIPNVKVILVDGFYRLSPVWFGLLRSLAEHGADVTVTFDFDVNRPTLFATTARALEILGGQFEIREQTVCKTAVTQLDAASSVPTQRPNDDLDRLESLIFAGNTARIEGEGDGSITLIDAPNIYSEVELVARALRREFDEGTPWKECTLFVRSYVNYAPIVRSVFERFEIPVSIPQPLPLLDSPAVRTLNALARVAAFDWQRGDVVRFLKSPKIRVDNLSVDLFVRSLARNGPTSGREAWLQIDAPDGLGSTFLRMADWADQLDAAGQESPIRLDTIAREIGLFEGDDGSLAFAVELIRSAARAARIIEKSCPTFGEFWEMAEPAVIAAVYTPSRNPDSVWVLDAYDARQREATFTAVLGLIERGFPMRINEDPFFRDDERAALRAAGIPLENRMERADDERLLFYRCITEPTERLVLSYPRSSDDSDTLRSFYLNEVQAAAPVREVFKELSDVAPTVEECVNEHDRLLAQCAQLVDSAGDGPPITWNQRLRDAAVASSDIARLVSETAALPALPRVTDAELRAELARSRRYSVTELETYNTCPFQYLLSHILHVRPDEETAWLAERGTQYHEALTRQFRGNRNSMPVDELKMSLIGHAERLLEESNREVPIHRRRLLERFLKQALSDFAVREVAYRNKFRFTPAHFELAFGMPEDTDRPHDPASRAEPLTIESDGSRIELSGSIDRVDRGPNGMALVIDYKTGQTPKFEDLKSGQSIQLPVYMMALERIWDLNPVAGCFDSAREPSRRRIFRSDQLNRFGLTEGVDTGPNVKPMSADEMAEMYDAAKNRILKAVSGVKSANILPTPGDHCRFCDYRDCCRTSKDHVHDGEPFDILKDAASEIEVQ